MRTIRRVYYVHFILSISFSLWSLHHNMVLYLYIVFLAEM